MFALSFGLIAFWITTQWFIGSHPGYNGNNGDHLYYVAYSKIMNGERYRDALASTAEFFNYQRPSEVLDYEWLDVAIAPLIYPRLVLSALIAGSIKLFGIYGVWIPSLACGVITHSLWWGLLRTRLGNQKAGIVMLLISLSPQLTELRFGIYTEAPLLLFLTLWFVYVSKAFQPDSNVRFINLAPLMLLTPLIGLTRQSLLIPIVGFLIFALNQISTQHSSAESKRLIVNMFLVLIWLFICQALINKWAPYDSTVFAMVQNGVTNRLDLIMKSPENLVRIFGLESSRLLNLSSTFDPIYFISVLVIPIFSVKIIGWRQSIVVLGVTSVCLVATVLNGRATGLRYLAPVIPVFLSSIAHKKVKSPVASSSKRNHIVLYLLSSLVLLVSFLSVSTLRYQPSIKNWQPISSASFRTSWPLTIDSGWLGCAGHDLQVWFKSPDGKLYAVSGTALQRRFFAPSIEELSIKKRDQLISPTRLLMKYGLRLCGATFMTK